MCNSASSHQTHETNTQTTATRSTLYITIMPISFWKGVCLLTSHLKEAKGNKTNIASCHYNSDAIIFRPFGWDKLDNLTKTILNYLHCLGQGLKLHLFTHNQHSTTGGLWSRQFPPFLWTTDRFSPIHVQGQWHLIQELHVHVQYQINIFTGIHKAHFLWKLMQSVVAIF